MPLNLPKRCPNCARKCVKSERGYWLCDPTTGGCGWTDDPNVLQPDAPTVNIEQIAGTSAEQ